MSPPVTNPQSAILLADLGGTTSRFGLSVGDGGPERIAVMANDDLPGPAAGIARYLEATGARPQAAVLAIAGPIDGDAIVLTNRAWRFRLGELAAQFGFAKLRAINDFEAVAWAVPGLAPIALRAIGSGRFPGGGVRLVCGPGTGLGVAALIPDKGSWRVIASEGGHVSFGAAESDEEPIFGRLRETVGAVSAETVLSGPGLVRLHQAVNRLAGRASAEDIVAQAASGDDAARATVSLFVRLLGRFAGDMALAFKATGAVYLTGGVSCGIASLIDAREFRRAFEAHRPYERLLAAISTFLITDPEPGLLGCAVFAERMLHDGELNAVVSA